MCGSGNRYRKGARVSVCPFCYTRMNISPPQTTDRLNAKGEIVATHGKNGKPFSRADRDALAQLPRGTDWFAIHQVVERHEV